MSVESDSHGGLREIGVLALGALREFGVRNDLSERELWKGRRFVEASWRLARGACSFEPVGAFLVMT